MRSSGWALIQYNQCPYKKRRLGHRHAQRVEGVKTRDQTAMDKPRTEALEETDPADTVVLDFQPPEP